MEPTEILKKEHQLVLLMLRIMEAVCSRLEHGETVKPEDPAAMIQEEPV